jgi:hypothetical protein
MSRNDKSQQVAITADRSHVQVSLTGSFYAVRVDDEMPAIFPSYNQIRQMASRALKAC